MKVVVFGLTVSSSWGNGHATIWRGLCAGFARRGHHVVFFEKNVPYYEENRDLTALPGGGMLILYDDFSEVAARARRELTGADLALTTSYCPDALIAAQLIFESTAAIKAFYDLDTPVTLDRITRGEPVDYIPSNGLAEFDLVLSYTGGRALVELQAMLGARRVAALYGCVDPSTHFPVGAIDQYRSYFSYLGTYAADRQPALEALFVEPARTHGNQKFLIGGAQYPQSFPWTANIFFVRHMPPPLHPAFFSSSRATLNITRRSMAEYGHCPSGRLFEAAACGVPILTDTWLGLDSFFTPGAELLVVRSSADVAAALTRSDEEMRRIARCARERVLADHTAEQRIAELEILCEQAGTGRVSGALHAAAA